MHVDKINTVGVYRDFIFFFLTKVWRIKSIFMFTYLPTYVWKKKTAVESIFFFLKNVYSPFSVSLTERLL